MLQRGVLGAEYLLFLNAGGIRLDARPVDLTPYWAPLAPTNEQVFGEADAWSHWVIEEIKASSRTGLGQPLQSTSRVGGNTKAPRRIYEIPPMLPDAARKAGIRGTVIILIDIAEDGTVPNARVLRSIPLLDAAALECARQWRYEPALLNGKPVQVTTTEAVSFRD
jgi:TonB family protein